MNRDPIEEEGGSNLYGFVGNDPIRRVDFLGKSWRKWFPFLAPFISGGCKKAVKDVIDSDEVMKKNIEKIIDAIKKGREVELPCAETSDYKASMNAWKNCNSLDGDAVLECKSLCDCWFGHVENRIVTATCIDKCMESYRKRCF